MTAHVEIRGWLLSFRNQVVTTQLDPFLATRITVAATTTNITNTVTSTKSRVTITVVMLKEVDYFAIIKGTPVALILVVAAWFS